MDRAKFSELLERRLERTRAVLDAKSAEYSTDADKLINFKQAALMQGITPAEALRGMWAKHLVSVFDMIGKMKHRAACPDESSEERSRLRWLIDEKITDTVNYAILLEALFLEELGDG